MYSVSQSDMSEQSRADIASSISEIWGLTSSKCFHNKGQNVSSCRNPPPTPQPNIWALVQAPIDSPGWNPHTCQGNKLGTHWLLIFKNGWQIWVWLFFFSKKVTYPDNEFSLRQRLPLTQSIIMVDLSYKELDKCPNVQNFEPNAPWLQFLLISVNAECNPEKWK